MNMEGAQSVLSTLQRAVGADNFIVDETLRDFYSTDIREKRETALAIVQPTSIEALQAVVAACADAGVAVVSRGGGMSYSGGYTHDVPSSIALGTSKLNRIVDLNVTNNTVTVEAGVTWAVLDAELKKHGLRTPFYGPFSG